MTSTQDELALHPPGPRTRPVVRLRGSARGQRIAHRLLIAAGLAGTFAFGAWLSATMVEPPAPPPPLIVTPAAPQAPAQPVRVHPAVQAPTGRAERMARVGAEVGDPNPAATADREPSHPEAPFPDTAAVAAVEPEAPAAEPAVFPAGAATDPVPAAIGTTGSITADDPAPEPVAADPVPADPVPADPAPADPAPADPAPADPAPAEASAAGEPVAEPPAPSAEEPSTTGSIAAATPPAAAPPAAAPPTATPPAAAQAPKPAVPGTGRFTVQVGTFSVPDNAERLTSTLSRLGFEAYTIDWTDRAGARWRVVRVGRQASEADARRLLAELRERASQRGDVIRLR